MSTLDDLALLVTPEEAASRLKVGRSKVYELMRTGALPSLKIGGSDASPRLLCPSVLRVRMQEAS